MRKRLNHLPIAWNLMAASLESAVVFVIIIYL
jgi:hypothetical protein